VMAFAYSGMLGVFLTALLTRRGNNASVLIALLSGVIVVTLLQDPILGRLTMIITGTPRQLASFWTLPIGALISTGVCMIGSPCPVLRERPMPRGFAVEQSRALS
jgi:SSS family solute:Na+ symporter